MQKSWHNDDRECLRSRERDRKESVLKAVACGTYKALAGADASESEIAEGAAGRGVTWAQFCMTMGLFCSQQCGEYL